MDFGIAQLHGSPSRGTSTFRARAMMITHVKKAGHVPLLVRVAERSFFSAPAAVVDEVVSVHPC